LFKSLSRFNLLRVSRTGNGVGPALNPLIAGEIPIIFTAPGSASHLESGRLRAPANLCCIVVRDPEKTRALCSKWFVLTRTGAKNTTPRKTPPHCRRRPQQRPSHYTSYCREGRHRQISSEEWPETFAVIAHAAFLLAKGTSAFKNKAPKRQQHRVARTRLCNIATATSAPGRIKQVY
jgi:hypothetical protein